MSRIPGFILPRALCYNFSYLRSITMTAKTFGELLESAQQGDPGAENAL